MFTDLEDCHFVCKVKLVVSTRGFYWRSGGFILAILCWYVFPLVQRRCFVPIFFCGRG